MRLCIHLQGAAPRLFNHTCKRIRVFVISRSAPRIAVQQQHRVVMLLPFDFTKLPRPDKTQRGRPDAFALATLTRLKGINPGFQGIGEAGDNSSIGGRWRIRQTEVNTQGQ